MMVYEMFLQRQSEISIHTTKLHVHVMVVGTWTPRRSLTQNRTHINWRTPIVLFPSLSPPALWLRSFSATLCYHPLLLLHHHQSPYILEPSPVLIPNPSLHWTQAHRRTHIHRCHHFFSYQHDHSTRSPLHICNTATCTPVSHDTCYGCNLTRD